MIQTKLEECHLLCVIQFKYVDKMFLLFFEFFLIVLFLLYAITILQTTKNIRKIGCKYLQIRINGVLKNVGKSHALNTVM